MKGLKMSMVYCEHCDKNIDTDYEAEHFDVKKIPVQIWTEIKKSYELANFGGKFTLKSDGDRFYKVTKQGE